MEILRNSVNFGAKFLSSEKVLKYKELEKTYKPDIVSFVEIEPNNFNDIKSIDKATNNWFYDTYGCCIIFNLKNMTENFAKGQKHSFFALTSQNDNYDKLNSDKIIGLAQITLTEGKSPQLNYLQVNPDYIEQYNLFGNRTIKGAGSAVLKALQKIYDSILLKASSSGLAYFYKKNSFKLIDEATRMYFWKK